MMVRERKHTTCVNERSRVHACETPANVENCSSITSGKKFTSRLKRFPSGVKKRGNRISACPEHVVQDRRDVDVDLNGLAKRGDVNLSEVVTHAYPTGEGLSNGALNQQPDILNVCEFNRSTKYPAEKKFSGDIPQCWLRESCMQLMDMCEEVSYIDYLRPPRGLCHENGKEDERAYERDFVAFGNTMTSDSSYKHCLKQPKETNSHDKGDVIIDDLTNSSVKQHHSVITEELETEMCDCYSMRDNETKYCWQDSKEKLALNGRYSRSEYCPCFKRGRNTKLKVQFCSLNSLENIYEVDEPDSTILHRHTRSDADILTCDENANIFKDRKFSKGGEKSKIEDCVALDKSETELARLHDAAKSGDVEKIEVLIENGVPVDGLDTFGWTPLYNALENNQIECAELLLDVGANPNFEHKQGKTMLHVMASLGNCTALEMLIDYGVEVNVIDNAGWPALHDAMRGNHFKCAALLMSSGTDVALYTAKRVEEYQMVLNSANTYKPSPVSMNIYTKRDVQSNSNKDLI